MTRASLRILLNNTLAGRHGSELYVRDLTLALMRGGHFPVVYSTILGDVAGELRAATVPVVDDLRALNVAPDLIHGQHHADRHALQLCRRGPLRAARHFAGRACIGAHLQQRGDRR